MKQSTAELINEFRRFGVSAQEAKVYIALLQHEGVSGYQISKNAGIPSSKIYTILNILVERGFIVASDTRPVKYFPRPPVELLNELKDDLTSTITSLSAALQSFQNNKKPNGLLAWNITGRQDVLHKAKEIIETSEHRVFLATWAKELRPLRKVLTKAAARNVELHIVSYGPTNFNVGELYCHRPSDYPYRERKEHRFVLTTDDSKAIIANIGEVENDNGLWTENPGLVMLFRDFVIHEIYIIQIEQANPEEIKALAGRNWEKLRLS